MFANCQSLPALAYGSVEPAVNSFAEGRWPAETALLKLGTAPGTNNPGGQITHFIPSAFGTVQARRDKRKATHQEWAPQDDAQDTAQAGLLPFDQYCPHEWLSELRIVTMSIPTSERLRQAGPLPTSGLRRTSPRLLQFAGGEVS